MAEHALTNFHFELETGNLFTDQASLNLVESGEAPLNLIQLLEAGKLHVVEAQLAEPPDDKPDLLALADVLDVEKHGAIGKDAYEHLNPKLWVRDDAVGYTQWLDSIVTPPDQTTTRVTQVVIKQAHYLGIGISDSRIRRGTIGFSSLGDVYDAAGLLPNHRRGAYASWTDQDLADYAEGVLQDLLKAADGKTGYVDLNGEINRRAKAGEGPSCMIFRRDGGWPMKYLALNGYADMASMEPEDYVQWGVNFMFTNGGKLPNMPTINFLAHSKRAPAYQAFKERFDMPDYKERVKAAYLEQKKLREERRDEDLQSRMPAIQQEAAKGLIPACIISDASPREAVAIRAKWLLVNELFPKLSQPHKRVIAERVSSEEIEHILTRIGNVDELDIQDAADKLGLAEDLWPPDEAAATPYLKVPEELLPA